MRRLESSISKFTLQISSAAWKQISHLSAQDYRRLREALENLPVVRPSDSAPRSGERGEGEARATLSAIIGEYVVLYEVNASLRLITVVEFARRLSHRE